MRKSNNMNREKRIGAIAAMLLVLPTCAYAAGPQWYLRNADIMNHNDMARTALRGILWGITKVMVDFANACENLYDTAFGFIDITSAKTVNSFVAAYKPALIALMAFSVLYLGIILILQHEKKPKIGANICICVLCVCCSTFLFQEMNTLAHSFKDGIGATTKAEKMAYETVDSHLADLVRLNEKHAGLDSVNWSKKKEYGAGITSKRSFDAVDYTEVLNYKSSKYSWNGDTEDILKNKLITKYSGSKPVYETAEVSNGWFWNNADDTDLGNEFYYRYTFDFISAWMEIIALMIIYICMSYKCVRIAYELVVARLLAYLYSAELSGGEKMRKILVFIRDSYILLVVTALCIRIYALINSYLEGQTGIQGIPKGLIMLFIAFSVIDGPNLVEKLLGMDAGLRSSTARILAIGRIGLGAGKAMSPKGIAGAVNNVRSGQISRGGIAAGAVGATAGVMNERTGKREGGIMSHISSGREKGTDGNGSSKEQPASAREKSSEKQSGREGKEGTRAYQTAPPQKGPKGDKGDRGFDGRDRSSDFMNEQKQGHDRSDGPTFMEQREQRRSAGPGPATSMPQRRTSSASHIMDDKKGNNT